MATLALVVFLFLALGGGVGWANIGGRGTRGGHIDGRNRGTAHFEDRHFDDRSFSHLHRDYGLSIFPYPYVPYYAYNPYYGYSYDPYCNPYSPSYDPRYCYPPVSP